VAAAVIHGRDRYDALPIVDIREYPRSVMPDVLWCWVFHLPPALGYA
jgi:hypothetical protein